MSDGASRFDDGHRFIEVVGMVNHLLIRAWHAIGTAAILGLPLLLAAPTSSATESLKIAAWNVEHLMAEEGTGCKPREAEDYALVRHYAEELDADVIALQEIENTAAARRVFDPEEYAVEVSRRDGADRGECRDHPGQIYGPLHTGFAIRHGVAYERHADAHDPSVGGRHGVDVEISMDGETLRLLSVHLPSGCFTNDHDARGEPACDTLDEHMDLVADWLDTRTREGQPAAALGDFNRRFTLPDDRLWARLSDGNPAGYTNLAVGHEQICRGPYEGMPYIDHIILNPMAVPYVASDLLPVAYDEPFEDAPSDHCPIAVRMRSGSGSTP